MYCLVTGAAGFIGYHLSKKLLSLGYKVLGIDNLNDYYDVSLKQARLNQLQAHSNFEFLKLDITDHEQFHQSLAAKEFDTIYHLAAQPGVSYSLQNPYSYINNNILGFTTILEFISKQESHPKLVYASSSSVYGNNKKIPFNENDDVKNPASLYGLTKLVDEMMADLYHRLHNINSLGLRFFTVYGPYGRPDMAPYLFTKAIDKGKTIQLNNNGQMKRDFTYIDDIIDGVIAGGNLNNQGHTVINLGNNKPVELLYFVKIIEQNLGKTAITELRPMPKGEVLTTYADIDNAKNVLNFSPKTTIEEGMKKFIEWYKEYK